MAKVKPFKALIYSGSKVESNYSSVVAPPYDVIPESMRDELYEKSPYNIVRLILGKSCPNDDEENNKYTRAGRLLSKWQEEEVFARDKADSLYIYVQEYECGGKKHRRIGFLGMMKIEDPGEETVIPHEYTLAKPKEDRMNLIKQVKGNLSPIFVLYEDSEGSITDILENTVSSSEPLMDINVSDGRHQLWRLCDEDSLKRIASMMSDKKVYIADGHHRYEVARAYRDSQRPLEGYNGNADYILMYFTDMAGNAPRNDLTVFATHRAVKVMPAAESEVADKLSECFDIVEFNNLSKLMEHLAKGTKSDHLFGYFGGEKYLLAKLKDEKALQKIVNDEKSEEWKQLDVSILHSGILRNILGVEETEGNITYVKDPGEAEALVKDGSHMAAFFLNPTRVEQIKAVAENGDMMPQKSTYFYPKLLSGLVINKFD